MVDQLKGVLLTNNPALTFTSCSDQLLFPKSGTSNHAGHAKEARGDDVPRNVFKIHSPLVF